LLVARVYGSKSAHSADTTTLKSDHTPHFTANPFSRRAGATHSQTAATFPHPRLIEFLFKVMHPSFPARRITHQMHPRTSSFDGRPGPGLCRPWLKLQVKTAGPELEQSVPIKQAAGHVRMFSNVFPPVCPVVARDVIIHIHALICKR
jgi:hypothetical protein